MYEVGDNVTVISDNVRVSKGTKCRILDIYEGDYYIRNIDSEYCCWAKDEDLELDTPSLDEPLTAENINMDGVLHLAEALIKNTKRAYISVAKARFQTTGNWDHRKERNATLQFVREDPYHIFYSFGTLVSAEDIFDAWDKEMLKDIAKNDWVQVITSNTGLMRNAIGWINGIRMEGIKKDHKLYHVITPTGNQTWCTIDDIELLPRPRRADMPKKKEKK